MNKGVLSGLKSGIANIVRGMVNQGAAAAVITPTAPDESGLVIKAPTADWGARGVTTPLGTDGYATGQFLTFLKAGGTTLSDSIRMRVDATAGWGTGGALHLATGLNQDSTYAPSQCFWLNPYIDTNGMVISAPSTANSGTWTHWPIIYNSDRSGTARNLFWVDQYGIVNGVNSPPGATRYRLLDHFETAGTQTANFSQIGGSAASTVLSGTGSGTLQAGHSFPGHPGVIDAGTGTTTTGYCAAAFYEELFTFTAASSDVVFGATIQIPTASDGTNSFEAKVGMMNTFTGTEPTDGLYFRWQAADANWEAVNARGGAETVTDSGVAGAAGSWVNFKIRYNPGGNAVYYINDTQVASVSTNKPTDATSLVPLCGVVKSAGTTARHIYVDAMNLDMALDTDLEQILGY